MKRNYVDFFEISEAHSKVHELLENWARYVSVNGPRAWATHPMWLNYRSNAWQWHRPEIKTPVDAIGAVKIDKLVTALPDKNRDALRWCYIFRTNPAGMAKKLAVTSGGLMLLVVDGRTMVKNKLTKS
jgi:hypothetical protein